MKLPRRWLWATLAVLSTAPAGQAGLKSFRLGGAGAVAARPVPADEGKAPTGYVAQTPTPPTIDGRIEEKPWGRAQVLRIARTLDGSARAGQLAEVRLLRDAKRLYIALRCLEPFASKVRANQRGRDQDLWNDDSVEIFLGTDDDWDYYHFIVNARGTTYDGFNQDKAWNCGAGLRAAGAVGTDQWTAEMAIPLARIAFKGKIPSRWIANFNRNRHARGRWEEYSWSPTFSGKSHVPRKFGRLVFEDPPKELLARPDRPAGAGGMTILKCRGGAGVVRFDLPALPKGTRIVRADLLVRRNGQLTGRDDEILVNIEIHPLAEAFTPGGEPEGLGKALRLRGPWFDRFDATAAVGAWLTAKPRPAKADLFVKTFPLWDAEATCLDVVVSGPALPGEPVKLPPPATGLRVRHRAGQTFLTWTEIEDLLRTDRIKWGDLRKVLTAMDGKREVRYHVYRSDRRITAESLPRARRIAVVRPLSCWNVNGRNIEKSIDAALSGYSMIHGQWNPFVEARVDGKFGLDCLMDRFVIPGSPAGGPLPRGTGLYVHTAAEAGRFYYAVVTAIDGVQNLAALSEGNSLAHPLAEAAAEPEPVLQKVLPRRPFWDYGEKRHHYVRWVAGPKYGNLPCQYYNWAVAVPDRMAKPARPGGAGKAAPVELSLHRDGRSYYVTQYRIDRTSIVVSPHDFPLKTWWYGYHEAHGTLKSFRQGVVHPYTERRILSFLEWVCRSWPADRKRILVTGMNAGAAYGARTLSRHYPEVFHRCEARGRSGRLTRQLEAVWGKGQWDIKTDTGKSVWSP